MTALYIDGSAGVEECRQFFPCVLGNAAVIRRFGRAYDSLKGSDTNEKVKVLDGCS